MHLATGEKTHLLLDPNQNVDCIQAENTFREIIPELRIREPGRRRSGQLIQLSGQSTDAMERESEGSRSEEHTSELQSLMRISYAVFCLKKNKTTHTHHHTIR